MRTLPSRQPMEIRVVKPGCEMAPSELEFERRIPSPATPASMNAQEG